MNWSSIIANFQTFNLADLLDVLVVTFVIYQIFGIVSRTRAGQVARGALVVALIYLIATTAHMRTVTWIMNSLLQVGLLTLVVIFQPEIRRALERMGQTDKWFLKLFRVRHVDPATRGSWRSAIIAICDAAERFSETKTGALIVLERRTDLSEIERTGTPVDCEVNPEVLGTIFYEGTPLHDGAAKNGVLIRHFDRQTLYTRLVDEMIPKEAASDKGRSFDTFKGQVLSLMDWRKKEGEGK